MADPTFQQDSFQHDAFQSVVVYVQSLVATASSSATLATLRVRLVALAATVASSASLVAQFLFGVVLSATAPSVASFTRLISMTPVTAAASAPKLLKLFSQTLSTVAPSTTSLITAINKFLKQQLALAAKWMGLSSAVKRVVGLTPTAHRPITIRLVGPDEMTFKAGTAIQLEATFADADGNLYDPDAGTVKLYVKDPSGAYVTGYVYGVSGALVTKVSTGLYRITYQTARGDAAGTWLFEVEGYVGTERSFDDLHIQLRA